MLRVSTHGMRTLYYVHSYYAVLVGVDIADHKNNC